MSGKPGGAYGDPTVQKTAKLLSAMSEIGPQITTVAREIRNEGISPKEQVAFGKALVRIGELIQLHALEVRGLELD